MKESRTQELVDAVMDLASEWLPKRKLDPEEEPHEQALRALQELKKESSRWRSMRTKTNKKLNELVDAMVAFASLDFFHKAPVGTEGDLFDALATGLNALGEELHSSTVSRGLLHDIISSMLDTLLVTDEQGQIQLANTALYELLGYKESELLDQPVSMIFAEESLEKIHLPDILQGQAFQNQEVWYQAKSGQKIPVSLSISILHQPHKETKGVVCLAQDITERKRQEEQLKSSLEEKVVLLKEVHHRVKNNMQIVSSLLYLQAEFITDEHILSLFQESQNRIHSLALVHEQLYKSQDLARIDFAVYVESLAAHLWNSYGGNSLQQEIDISPIDLTIELAIPCGLILNELVSNARKHAFPNTYQGQGKVTIRLRTPSESEVILIVEDNGIGIPPDEEVEQTQSLGLTLIRTLAKQLRGNVEFFRDNGTKVVLTFPYQHESPGQKRITT
ncbi:MAG: PAS domain S-box protein [Deltaproteobacteria bacterium]|nr:MAG: PAS domain S-box protein [Deltaproteobacteria bacterium]